MFEIPQSLVNLSSSLVNIVDRNIQSFYRKFNGFEKSKSSLVLIRAVSTVGESVFGSMQASTAKSITHSFSEISNICDRICDQMGGIFSLIILDYVLIRIEVAIINFFNLSQGHLVKEYKRIFILSYLAYLYEKSFHKEVVQVPDALIDEDYTKVGIPFFNKLGIMMYLALHLSRLSKSLDEMKRLFNENVDQEVNIQTNFTEKSLVICNILANACTLSLLSKKIYNKKSSIIENSLFHLLITIIEPCTNNNTNI